MTESKNCLLSELLFVDGGIIKTETLNNNGFTSRDISHLLKEGVLEKIKQGHYVRKNRIISDIEIAARLIPMGVLCLFNAIEHYELATVNPSKICMSLPRGVTCPTLPSNLIVQIYHMTSRHYMAGINEVETGKVLVKMYDIEKTVCDCFKYDHNIEKGIALEVLKNYVVKGNCNVQKLLEYAKLLGKKKTIYPYVEALI